MEDAAANAGPTPGDPNKPLQQLEQEIKPRVGHLDLPEFSELRPSGLKNPVLPVRVELHPELQKEPEPELQPSDAYELQQFKDVAELGFSVDDVGEKVWDGTQWLINGKPAFPRDWEGLPP